MAGRGDGRQRQDRKRRRRDDEVEGESKTSLPPAVSQFQASSLNQPTNRPRPQVGGPGALAQLLQPTTIREMHDLNNRLTAASQPRAPLLSNDSIVRALSHSGATHSQLIQNALLNQALSQSNLALPGSFGNPQWTAQSFLGARRPALSQSDLDVLYANELRNRQSSILNSSVNNSLLAQNETLNALAMQRNRLLPHDAAGSAASQQIAAFLRGNNSTTVNNQSSFAGIGNQRSWQLPSASNVRTIQQQPESATSAGASAVQQQLAAMLRSSSYAQLAGIESQGPTNRQQQQQQQQAAGIAGVATQPEAAAAAASVARPPAMLYISCDDDSLTPYQVLARKQIELFETTAQDAIGGGQGRSRSTRIGQVGIRCRHCARLPFRERAKGSTYYPTKLEGIYQAGQNMTNSHLAQHCQSIPQGIRDELLKLGNRKSAAGGGKEYWAGGAKILGVVEDQYGLRFEHRR